MTENTPLRFSICANLLRMPYGTSRHVGRDQVLAAWPPTGDHDRSIEAVFHAMALANGGHRQEKSYTTDERIERDLDDSFTWLQDPMTGDYVFHRSVSHCPKCHGKGFYRAFPTVHWPDMPIGHGTVGVVDEVVDVRTIECHHAPT